MPTYSLATRTMPDYRRLFVPGGTYFFTVVTQDRRPILNTATGRDCLRNAIQTVKRKQPFDMLAIVLLAEHVHTVWALPPGDDRYPLRWAQIKEAFTRTFLTSGGGEAPVTASRTSHRERGVWQHRYWEHTCRDEDDLKRCVDYIHWNPVKHGLSSASEIIPGPRFIDS